MASNIPPAFAAFFPAREDIAITPANKISIAVITPMPFTISPTLICDTIFITLTTAIKAPDIAEIISPAFVAFGPAKADTAIIPANKSSIAVITANPFIISASGIPDICFITWVIINIAPDINNSMPPALVAFCPAIADTATIPKNRLEIAPITTIPFNTSSPRNSDIRLITTVKISNAADIPININPALSIPPAKPPLVIAANVANTIDKPTMTPPNANKLSSNLSDLISDICFKAIAIRRMEVEMPNMAADIFPKLESTDTPPILSAT